VTGWQAFFLIFVVNLLWLSVTWLIVGFGLDRIAAWAVRQWWRKVDDILGALASGLPMLLVFSAFFALTAETWEVVYEIGTLAFLGLLGLLLGLMALVLLITWTKELRRHCDFTSWSEVWEDALDGVAANDPVRPLVEGASREMPQTTEPSLERLGPRGRLNALLVLAVYQATIFLPITVVAFGFFLLLGHIAVEPEVAAPWVLGDSIADPKTEGARLYAEPLLEHPWVRVAVVLAVFSVLYLTVTVLADDKHRGTFFGVADKGIRKRLAMRRAYQEAEQLLSAQDAAGLDGQQRRPVAAVDQPIPG
jgi:hypothetical protein